jgi:hypothetical protein
LDKLSGPSVATDQQEGQSCTSMADTKRAYSPENNGEAGAIVKKQRIDDGSVVVSAKQPKQVSLITVYKV